MPSVMQYSIVKANDLKFLNPRLWYILSIRNKCNINICPECGTVIESLEYEDYCPRCGLVTQSSINYTAGLKYTLPYGLKIII